MKKILLTTLSILTTAMAFSQKPTAGNMSLETRFNIDFTKPMEFYTPYIKFRYFLHDNLALRIGLGINYSENVQNLTSTSVTSQTPPPSTPITVETGNRTISGFASGVSFGVERHFKGTEKLSPYFGAEFLLTSTGAGMKDVLTGSANTNKMNVTVTGASSDTASWTSKSDSYSTIGGGKTSFGLRVLFGADYYFTNSIFIGGEMGWGYMYSTYADQSYSKSTPAGSIQTENGNISLGSTQVNIDMMNHPTGTIRFGVKF